MKTLILVLLALEITVPITCDVNVDFEPSLPESGNKSSSLICLGAALPSKVFDQLFSKPLQTRFHIKSRNSPLIILRHANIIPESFNFNIKRRTVIIVHGYMTKGTDSWMEQMRDAFLTWGDVNVIIADWSKDSQTWNYFKAASGTKTVGNQLATILEKISKKVKQNGITNVSKWGTIYCVGHSLGAHTCSHMAKELKSKKVPWKVARITALDPARPCFTDPPVLDKSDADLVDVIHTNSMGLHKKGLGLHKPLGHVDFYPNGGQMQPACVTGPKKKIFLVTVPQNIIGETSICSHALAHDYLMESLYAASAKNCSMWGYSWDETLDQVYEILEKQWNGERGCSEMGINAENYKCDQGKLFVHISASTPYCSIKRDDKKQIMAHLRKYNAKG